MTRPSKSPQESGKPPRAAVAACALAGLCALLLMAAAVVLGPPPAEGFASEREAAVLASPAGWLLDRAVHMRIALVAFSLWGVTAWLRCPDAEVRHLLAAVAGLLALWMALVIVKWKVADIGLGTLLWYAYYIPMALLPVSCAAIGARTAGLASRPPVRRALRAALAVSCALALLALTNNRHQAFFLFDEPTPGMIGDYTYGWAHAVFLVWSVLCYAAFFASLAYAARRRLRLMLAPVVGVALLGIAYCVAYVLRFEAILGLNFSLTYALVLVCALELSLDLGLIPSTVFLSRTFDALPLDLAIVSREGETFRATRAARGLSGATRGVLASSAPRSLSWSEPDDADTRHHAWPISGGWAHLAQDVSGLNRVRGSLAARSSELARRNAMLENERQISQATSSLMAEERLVDEVEAALLALCAPPAMEALGGVWNLVALVDAPFFLARALLALVGDVQRHKSELTRFSIAETMNTVPVGALVVDAGGRSLLLNDSMRALLRDLGLPTNLSDLRGTWDGIARSARPARLSRGLDEGPGPRVVIDAPNGRVLLLKRIDGLEIDLPAKAISAVGVFSLDVTELDAATRELEGANEELVRIGQQLEERIAEVESIAEQAAYLRMRARVHDVVGQRLSIFQRYLESGRADQGSVEELTRLVNSIAQDLRAQDGPDAETALKSLVDAFALVDVDVRVGGRLPGDASAAAFARVAREAVTNSCRHAQAHRVDIRITRQTGGDGAAWTEMLVTDDGGAAREGYREGTGIPGMRRDMEELGGSLEVVASPRFAVTARAPLPKEEDQR